MNAEHEINLSIGNEKKNEIISFIPRAALRDYKEAMPV